MAQSAYVGDDIITGTNGDDILYGGNAKDEMHGLDGNDGMESGWLSDLLDGGAGNDLLIADDGDDFLYGGNGKDRLFGGAGNDLLHGGNGHDELFGSDGNDFLYGENGKDMLSGEDGSDLLDGGRGNDILSGGRGADKFILGHCAGHDTITDFSGPAKGSPDIHTITFDDIPQINPEVGDKPIPNGYGGLSWSDGFRTTRDDFNSEPNGYSNGVTSGHWVAYNATASYDVHVPVFIYDDEDFSVKSGQFTAAWNDGLKVTATAYDDGVQTGTQTFTVDTAGPALITFGSGFDSIDKMEFTASGGVKHGQEGGGEFFALDDLVVSREASTSEGDAIVLAGGCGADVQHVLDTATQNADGDAVITYGGATMTLLDISPDDLKAEYFLSV